MKTQKERHEEQLKQSDEQSYHECKKCGSKFHDESECCCDNQVVDLFKKMGLIP